jgi:hypothetical protein
VLVRAHPMWWSRVMFQSARSVRDLHARSALVDSRARTRTHSGLSQKAHMTANPLRRPLKMYLTEAGQIGRYPSEGWQPGGIQRRRQPGD